MADDFGQRIEGLHAQGDTPIATDNHIAVFALDSSGDYDYLNLDASGALRVSATDIDIRDLTQATDSVAIGDGTTLVTVNADNGLEVHVNNTLTVQATDFDIRDLTHVSDSIKIGDGTDFLAIESDGSINVNANIGATDSVYDYGSANLVKDTETTVVTESPSVDTLYAGVMVSGAGYCEWAVKFGTTSSEAIILKFWTTPSNPTYYVDLPDYLTVSSGETILVTGTNREKGASPSSDFTGHASLINKA